MEDLKFLGHDPKYWLELEKYAKKLDITDFIEEIATLRGKISFYESRIKQLADFLNRK